VILHELAAKRPPQTLNGPVVLYRDWDASERALIVGANLRRRRKRALRVDLDEGIELSDSSMSSLEETSPSWTSFASS
jgi:hypothetical protein